MKVLIVTHRKERPRFEEAMISSFVAVLGADRINVEECGWSLPSLGAYDAVLYFVKFRQLAQLESLRWNGFSGIRAVMDHDAFHDYGGWWGSPHMGAWSARVPRLGFDTMIVSGLETQRHFERLGFRSFYLPKGFDPKQFFDLNGERDGIGHYGSPYGARMAMLRRVRGEGVEVGSIRANYLELNKSLNGFLSILVCNMTSRSRFGVVGRLAQRVAPGALLTLGPAPEPMAKNFEASAAGCAVFMDETPELAELGFVDAETALIYRDFDGLMDRLRFWGQRKDALRAIGRRAALLSLNLSFGDRESL